MIDMVDYFIDISQTMVVDYVAELRREIDKEHKKQNKSEAYIDGLERAFDLALQHIQKHTSDKQS